MFKDLNDEKKLLGQRFGLYVIALLTDITDKHIMDWVHEKGHTIDELTGEHVAFIVFYNSARWKAHLRSGGDIVDPVGTRRIFGRDELYEMAKDGDRLLKERKLVRMEAEASPRDLFMQSHPRHSIRIAEAIGAIDKMPCLLVIDGVKKNNFSIIPIQDESKLGEKLKKLRKTFYSPKNKEYLLLLGKLNELEQQLKDVCVQVRIKTMEINRLSGMFPIDSFVVSKLFNHKNFAHARKELENRIRAIHGEQQPKDIAKIIALFNEELFVKYKCIIKAEKMSDKHLKGLSEGDLPERNRQALITTYQQALHILLEAKIDNDILRKLTIEEWRKIFESSVSKKHELLSTVNSIQRTVERITVPRLRGNRLKMQHDLEELDAKLTALTNEIEKLERAVPNMVRVDASEIAKTLHSRWESVPVRKLEKLAAKVGPYSGVIQLVISAVTGNPPTGAALPTTGFRV